MASLGWVSSEGGPILVGDFELVRQHWRGAVGPRMDYDKLAMRFDEIGPVIGIDLNGADVVAWDVPTGSFEVERISDSSLRVKGPVRQIHYRREIDTHRLHAPSGWIVFLWAPEDESELQAIVPREGLRPVMSVAGSALIAKMSPGPLIAHQEKFDDLHGALEVLAL